MHGILISMCVETVVKLDMFASYGFSLIKKNCINIQIHWKETYTLIYVTLIQCKNIIKKDI